MSGEELVVLCFRLCMMQTPADKSRWKTKT